MIHEMDNKKPSYEELFEKVSNLEKQNKHLRDQQEFIKNNAELVIWGTNTAIWDWNYLTGELFFSDMKAEMLGYDPKELIPHVDTFTKRLHPDDFENTMENMRKLLVGEREIYEVEYRIQSKNGEWKWFYDKGKVVERDEDNRPIRIIGIASDITEKKRNAILLMENEERFRKLFNHSVNGIRIADSNGIIIEENPKMFSITGIPTSEVIGKPVCDIIFRLSIDEEQTQENYDRIKNLCDSFIKTGIFPIQDKIEHRLNCQGTIKDVESSFFSVKTEKGFLLYSIVRDITDFKNVQKELLKAKSEIEASELKYRLIAENTSDGILVLGSNTQIQYVSPGYKKMHGISLDDYFSGNSTNIYKSIHPEDRDGLFANIYKAIENKQTELIYTYRVQHKNGYYFWREDNAKFIYDMEGNHIKSYVICRDITERKKTELELINAREIANESEKKYRLLAENLSDVIWVVDLNFQFKYLSRSSEKLFGYTKREIEKVQICDLFTVQTFNKSKQILSFHLDQFKHDGDNKPILYEMEGVHKEGYSIFIEISAKFQLDDYRNVVGIFGTARDITKRKIAEMNLKKLQTAVENLKACIVITDTNGNIEYANPFFTESTGYLPEEYIGKNPRILKTELHDSQYYQKMWESIKSGQTWEGEFCNQKKNGQLYWESVIISPVKDSNNEITHFVAVKSDITEVKNTNKDLQLAKEIAEENQISLRKKNTEFLLLNEELRQTNEELILARQKAEESDKLKSSFLENISHEIRTPLNAIVGFSNLLSQGDQSPEKLKTFTDIICKSSDKLIDIISDVIEISQIHANIIKPTLDEIDFISLVRNSVNSFTETAKLKNINLNLIMDIPYKKYLILTDFGMLNKTLNHIIENAIKFTYTGSVEIICEIRDQILQISVTDTGIGISEQMQRLIFEPFRQVEVGSTRVYGGIGLGLAIAKSHIELLNGYISLQSEPDKGTKVTISMPVTKPSQKLNSEKNNESTDSINTILIAEDEYNNFLYLKELLKESTLNVLYAANGREAFDICYSKNDIGMVLMDIKMPIMDGIESTKLIKALRPDLPIIAQTAFATHNEKKSFSKIGFDGYITKPIYPEILFKTLEKYLIK
jgi:PAS domain S-box-containing protein